MAKDEGIGMGTGLKETVPIVTKPTKWCTCDSHLDFRKMSSPCLGCLIVASVRTNFGTSGVKHLRRCLRPPITLRRGE